MRDFDNMSGEEAWDQYCYAAWVVHHQRKRFDAVRDRLNELRAQVAELILAKMGKL